MFGYWMEENNCIDDREKCYQIFRNQTGFWKPQKKEEKTVLDYSDNCLSRTIKFKTVQIWI